MKVLSKLLVVLVVLGLVFLTGCSNDEKAMVNAVKNGDTAKVQSLLDKGVSPNLKTEDGKTILMLAAYLGHTDIAQLLIEKGADVNARDNDGKTALMYAAETGNIAMAQLLLEKGADLNAVTNNGKTAIQIAQDNNQIAMVEFLSNWGKPVSAPIETPAPTTTSTPEPVVTPTVATTPVPTPVGTAVPVKSTNTQLNSVYFDLNKSIIRPNQLEVMMGNMIELKANPDLYIIISGHADERGSRQYNLALSEERAQTVQKYLLENGVTAERIIIYAFGKDYPLKKDHNEISWSINRRVDILEWDTVLTKEQVIEATIK